MTEIVVIKMFHVHISHQYVTPVTEQSFRNKRLQNGDSLPRHVTFASAQQDMAVLAGPNDLGAAAPGTISHSVFGSGRLVGGSDYI